VIPVEACYLGWQESLAQLALLVEPDIRTAAEGRLGCALTGGTPASAPGTSSCAAGGARGREGDGTWARHCIGRAGA